MKDAKKLVKAGFKYHSENQFIIYAKMENGRCKFFKNFEESKGVYVSCMVYSDSEDVEIYVLNAITNQSDIDNLQIIYNNIKDKLKECELWVFTK